MCWRRRLAQAGVRVAAVLAAESWSWSSSLNLRSGVFFRLHRVGWNVFAGEDEMSFVVDDPFDSLAFGELHGLGHGRREVDVILFAGLALDELNFGWRTHKLETSQITR
jgi:hypothetical protein